MAANNTSKNKVVGIFGLSADPPSGKKGHLGIVEYLISTNEFNEIWILPVYSHMYMTKKNLQPYEHRVNMCKLNFESLSTDKCYVKVSELEKRLYDDPYAMKSPAECEKQERIGTIDLIRYLQDKSPPPPTSSCIEVYDNHDDDALDIHLILGSDTFNDLMQGKWKESNSILDRVKIDVIERVQSSSSSNDNNAAVTPLAITIPSQYADKLNKTIFIHSISDTCLNDMSSTKIRQVLANRHALSITPSSSTDEHPSGNTLTAACSDDEFLKQALQPNVYQYIKDHHLYLN